jgi:hypothetical protein
MNFGLHVATQYKRPWNDGNKLEIEFDLNENIEWHSMQFDLNSSSIQ